MEAREQQRIDFETDSRDAHSLFVAAMRRAIGRQKINATSFHVLELARWIWHSTTRRSSHRPDWREFRETDLAEHFFLGRTALRGVIARALETKIVKRKPANDSGGRCEYAYSIDVDAINAWLKQPAAPSTEEKPKAQRHDTAGNPMFGSRTSGKRTADVREANKGDVREANNDVREANKNEANSFSLATSKSHSSFVEAPAPFVNGEAFGAKEFTGEELDEMRRQFHRLQRIVYLRTEDDRRLLRLVCVLLVRGVLAESVIEDCLEAVELKKPKNRAAFFRSCLVNQCRARRLNFHELEKTCPLPQASQQGAAPCGAD